MPVENDQCDTQNILEHEKISSILFRVSKELKILNEEIGKIESLVSEIPIQSFTCRKKIILGLQNFDHVRQVIAEIAKFVDGLGIQGEASWKLSSRVASETLTLSALASRLQGILSSSTPLQTETNQDCYLFDEDD